MSISLCTAITFAQENKTLAQKALEAVEEYFYLGDKPRVTIFAPDDNHSESWALQDRRDRHRSWTITALKILSYCTLILPLIGLLLKVTLRWCLNISSVPLDQRFLPNSPMEAKLPATVLQHVGSFLDYKTQGHLAQAGMFASKAAHKTQDYYTTLLSGLKSEVDALPPGPLAHEPAQRLLVSLITSPAIGHPKYWIPVMQALMDHLDPDSRIDDTIQNHAKIADLIATSVQSISPKQLSQFYRYLGQKRLFPLRPWVVYRIFEQYSLRPELTPSVERRALKEYLTQHAAKHIHADPEHMYISNSRYFVYHETNIDPVQWFGLNGQNASLWQQSEDDEMPPIPDLLLEVLLARIESLRDAARGLPLQVRVTGRYKANMPYNFTLELARRITQAKIFFHTDQVVNAAELDPNYVERRLGSLNEKELIKRYPKAVVARTEQLEKELAKAFAHLHDDRSANRFADRFS